MALRANASLCTVAEWTRGQANRYYREWSQLRRVVRECTTHREQHAVENGKPYVEAYALWRANAELAAHLERLAGLPVHDEYGQPRA